MPVERPRVYALCYFPPPSELSDPQKFRDLHCTRDPDMKWAGVAAAERCGYAWAGEILALPYKLTDAAWRKQKTGIREGDLLFKPIRPPMDDKPESEAAQAAEAGEEGREPTRRPTWPSRLPIESDIFAALREELIFASDRERLILRPELSLPEHARHYAQCLFNIYSPAKLKERRAWRGTSPPLREPRPTVTYIVSIPRVPPIGFRLVCAFGMGGPETKTFAELLRSHWPHLLERAIRSPFPTLAIAEFQPPSSVPHPLFRPDPESLGARIVAEVEIAPGARQQRAC
jgi:hypothetical protein